MMVSALKSSFFSILMLFLFASRIQAQIELKADSSHVETGNLYQLHLRIPAGMGKPDSVTFSAWDDVLPTQNIVQQTAWKREGNSLTKELSVLFFEADTIQLPALPISFSNGDTAFSNPLQIIVTATPSPDDLNDMAPIKDIHREQTIWTDYLPWIFGVLLVLAILMVLFWLTKRQKVSKMQSRSIELPPHELALKKLEVLTRKQWISQGYIKEHYAELTFILREFLEKRFGIPALESTTEETVFHLNGHDFTTAQTQALQTLLEQADLAKFAKIMPPESFHIESMETTKSIINQFTAPPISPI